MLEFEIVLPCYNEGNTLHLLLEKFVSAAQRCGYTPTQFQLLLIENGSTDSSSQILDELKCSPSGSWFQKITVPVNQGYGFGLWTGIQATRAPVVGWAHADLQSDPSDVFRAFEAFKNSKNQDKLLVKGTRSGRNWKDIFVSRVFELVAFLFLGFYLKEINAQPKIFSRTLIQKIQNPPKTFAFDVYVLYKALKAGFKIETVPVLFPPRIHGVSNWAATFVGRYRTIIGIVKYMRSLAKIEGRL